MDVFRIHPAVGIARIGNSEDFIIAPETMAGSPETNKLMGGLPIRAGTLSDPVRSGDLRDAHGALKRQAARFRIFKYSGLAGESWPRGDGSEVTIGAHVGGKIVKDIIWTVHVANKKANTFVLVEDGPYQAIVSYEEGRLPPIRNPSISDPNAKQPPDGEKLPVLNNPQRVRELTIDPGPRAISGKSTPGVRFDKNTVAAYYNVAQSRIVTLDHYPKSFPADTFPQMDAPSGPIDTLGELRTDAEGRLLVLGGYGRAAGWKIGGAMPPLPHDVNNNQWFDDTSDGPVSATLVFEDDSLTVAQGAWVTTTDPSFAPQIKNVVSCWDDIYDCWVRELGLAPDIFDRDRGGYQVSYKPTFDDQLAPIFHSSALQQWVVNLDTTGSSAHSAVALIKATDDPSTTILQGTVYFRDPNDQKQYSDLSLMPFHLGDVYQPLLALRKTQYFFLQRWARDSEILVQATGLHLARASVSTRRPSSTASAAASVRAST